MHIPRTLRLLAALLALVLLLQPWASNAQQPNSGAPKQTDTPAQAANANTAPPKPPSPHDLTPADLEAFFDGVIPMQLQRSDIAGASVLVMKDGQLLLKKGYGYANFKDKKPVDPGCARLSVLVVPTFTGLLP